MAGQISGWMDGGMDWATSVISVISHAYDKLTNVQNLFLGKMELQLYTSATQAHILFHPSQLVNHSDWLRLLKTLV